MPGLTRLQRHGLTFDNAFTNACMCSPARSTLMTRLLPRPARRQVHAGDRHACAASTRRSSCSTSLQEPRHASMAAAGYTRRLQGQVALQQAGQRLPTWVPDDVNQYGFARWDPPDAGANQDAAEAGRRDAMTTTAAS